MTDDEGIPRYPVDISWAEFESVGRRTPLFPRRRKGRHRMLDRHRCPLCLRRHILRRCRCRWTGFTQQSWGFQPENPQW